MEEISRKEAERQVIEAAEQWADTGFWQRSTPNDWQLADAVQALQAARSRRRAVKRRRARRKTGPASRRAGGRS